MKTVPCLILSAALMAAGCCSTSVRHARPAASSVSHGTSPTHFWFDYPYQPSPGKRYWTAVGKTWIEQYENGHYSRFQVVGRTTVAGTPGTLVVKITGDPRQTWTGNEGNFQAFIPDRGSPKMQFYYRNKTGGQWQPWRPLAEMQGVE